VLFRSYKSLSQILLFPDARQVWRAWNAFSQVEVVESAAVHSAPGLSLAYRGALPTQRALFEDAESVSPLTDTAPPELLDALPVTLAYRLRPNARALILKPGGGIEVLAALNAGAREIVAVEDNPLLAHVAQQFAPHVFGDPRVRVVDEGARSFTARSRDKFDIVHIALSDPFRPVTAGAYALSENYAYTREAFREYLNHLNDDGILVVSRWLQLPPTEEARVVALAIAALEDAEPSQHVLALRSFSTLLLLVKRTPFTAREIAIAKAFAEERQFDWVTYPGMRADEANRFNVLRDDEYYRVFQQLLDRERRAQFLATYTYDITPPTDDRPFFFHFFKWEQTPQVLQLLGKLWQPFGGSGYLILLALLALSIVASGALILLPLLSLRGAPPERTLSERGESKRESKEATKQSSNRTFGTPALHQTHDSATLCRASHGVNDALSGASVASEKPLAMTLAYFACLGIGFLFVEIPLIQRFILFLDHPVYAFATVLFTLLIASGVGSALSERLPHRATLALLVVAILVYPLLLPFVFRLFLGYPFAVRVVIACVLLAPMGFLMGIPFPKGLARLNEKAPRLIPLAWGINGCASVISSILATIGAMSFGFSAVMLAGAGAYALALVTLLRALTARTAHP
jgi:spermidine synthase